MFLRATAFRTTALGTAEKLGRIWGRFGKTQRNRVEFNVCVGRLVGTQLFLGGFGANLDFRQTLVGQDKGTSTLNT